MGPFPRRQLAKAIHTKQACFASWDPGERALTRRIRLYLSCPQDSLQERSQGATFDRLGRDLLLDIDGMGSLSWWTKGTK